ncbi:MAG: transposase [Desulfococcaceae bacterium]
MPSHPTVKKHMAGECLRELYRKEKSGHVRTRLLAVIHLYEGKSTPEVWKITGVSSRAVRRWLKMWNDGGYGNMFRRFSGGPEPLPAPEQWEETVIFTENRGMDIKDVMKHIGEKYGISYSGIRKQICGKYRVPYGKPFKKTADVRRMRNPF